MYNEKRLFYFFYGFISFSSHLNANHDFFMNKVHFEDILQSVRYCKFVQDNLILVLFIVKWTKKYPLEGSSKSDTHYLNSTKDNFLVKKDILNISL